MENTTGLQFVKLDFKGAIVCSVFKNTLLFRFIASEGILFVLMMMSIFCSLY